MMMGKDLSTVLSMGKEIASGVVIIGGIALVLTGAELAVPAIAGIGAVASLGAGVFQALSAPHKKPGEHLGPRALR